MNKLILSFLFLLNSAFAIDQGIATSRMYQGHELSVLKNLVQGHELVNIHGYNGDIDTGTDPEDVGGNAGVMTFPSATAVADVSSSSANDDGSPAGTGARTLYLLGLDTNFDEVAETVTLNGTTPVNFTTSIKRVNKAYVVTAGSGGTNAGILTIDIGSDRISLIPAGKGKTLDGFFTVPNNRRLYLNDVYADLSLLYGDNGFQFELQARKDGGSWTTYLVGSDSGHSGPYRLNPKLVFDEKTDIKLRVIEVSTDNSAVSAGFSGIMVNEAQ